MAAYFEDEYYDQLSPSLLATLYNFCEWDEANNAPVCDSLANILAPDIDQINNLTIDDFGNSTGYMGQPYLFNDDYTAKIDTNEDTNSVTFDMMHPQFTIETEYIPYSVTPNSICEYDLIEKTNSGDVTKANTEVDSSIARKNRSRRVAMFKRKLKKAFETYNAHSLATKFVIEFINIHTRKPFTFDEVNYLLDKMCAENKILISNDYIIPIP